jgi:hypothetical protein
MRIRYVAALIVLIPTVLTWLCAMVIARRRTRVDRCPSCRSDRVRPSWPTIIDKFVGVSAVAAFRCEACLKRFYGRKSLVLRRS